MTVRVLVTGSRGWSDPRLIHEDLTEARATYGDELLIVHGDCPAGADAIASRWCTRHGVRQERHPADWQTHGRAAGPRRNAEMVDAGAALALAYVRDGSRGASGCVRLAEQAGIPVRLREWATARTDDDVPTLF